MRHGIIASAALAAAAAMAGTMVAVAPSRPERVNGPAERSPTYPKSWRINRSRRWPYAATYADARAMAPDPHRPIR